MFTRLVRLRRDFEDGSSDIIVCPEQIVDKIKNQDQYSIEVLIDQYDCKEDLYELHYMIGPGYEWKLDEWKKTYEQVANP